MHRQYARGVAQVQGIEGAVDEHPLRVEHRPHRAVADENARIECFEEGLHCRSAATQAARLRLQALTADLASAGGATRRSALSHTKSSLLYTASS